MTNVAEHSGATKVHVFLTARDNRLELTVADNGCGFDPAKKFSASSTGGRFGLSSMQACALLYDGDFKISSQKGEGTTIHFSLPCAGESVGDSI
jgi:two-component system, NarL family, sensor kinase